MLQLGDAGPGTRQLAQRRPSSPNPHQISGAAPARLYGGYLGVFKLESKASLSGAQVLLPVTVRRGGRRVTSAGDDGAYAARKPPRNSTLKFRVAGGGMVLRGFKASLAVFCVGPTLPHNRPERAMSFSTYAGARRLDAVLR